MGHITEVHKNQVKLLQISTILEKDSFYEPSLCNHYPELYVISSIKAILDNEFDVNCALTVDFLNQYSDSLDDAGNTALHLAAKSSNIYSDKVIKLLLSRGADFTCKNLQDQTPLHLVSEDERGRLDLLLSAHCEFHNEMNPHSNDGMSHFHLACLDNNVKVAKFFLDAGVSVNEAINNDSKKYPGYSALHIAMRNKDKDMVHLLLERGANYNHLNADGVSPLHLLSSKEFNSRNYESLENKDILDLISNPSVDNCNIVDHIGLTELHMCSIRKLKASEFDDVKKLLKDKENVNAAVNFDSPIWPGNTALHFAAHCNLQMVMLLLQNGADLMAKNAENTTPLDLCLKMYEPAEISQILKTRSEFESIQFQNGVNLIEIVHALENVNKLRELLNLFDVNKALPLNSPLWPGFTILHLAVFFSRKYASFVKLCLKRGADFTIQDANRMTALHLAFRLKRQKCIDEILNAHIHNSTNPVDDKNISLFHIACVVGNVKIVEKFLHAGLCPTMSQQTNILDNIKKEYYYSEDVYCKMNSLTELFLKYKTDPHLPDVDGFTWIHRVFLYGLVKQYNENLWKHPEALKSNPVAPGGLSHFHIACYTGNVSQVRDLLPFTKNINEPITSEILKYVKELPYSICIGDTPLHIAVKNKKKAVVSMLVREGADLEAKNTEGFTALHDAVGSYFAKDKRHLIKYLAEAYFEKQRHDEYGITQLHVACYLGDSSFIKKLLEQGDDLTSKVNFDSPVIPAHTPFNVFIRFHRGYPKDGDILKLFYNHAIEHFESSVQVNQDQELQGLTECQKTSSSQINKDMVNLEILKIFHYSCMGSDPDIVEKFIKSGLDVNAPSNCLNKRNDYCTALHYALLYKGCEEIIKVLLKYGADICLENGNGQTPLHMVALERLDVLNLFLSLQKVDINMKNAFGETVMQVLVQNKNARIDDFQIALSQDSARSMDLSTKMYIVKNLAWRFSEEDFESLIECLPGFSDLDDDGRNVLHHLTYQLRCYSDASINKYTRNIEILSERGCDLNQQDRYGKTPLHLATQERKDCEQGLISAGADVNVMDNDNKTAYMYKSDSRGHDAFAKLICLMKNVGLHVHPIDADRSSKLVSKDDWESEYRKRCFNRMKEVKIYKSFSLRDVLTDEMVMKFPAMPLRQRQAIRDCLKSEEIKKSIPYGWSSLFKMQLRKASKRKQLLKSMVPSLRELLDPRLPDHCLEFILIPLSMEDWHNVLQAERDL